MPNMLKPPSTSTFSRSSRLSSVTFSMTLTRQGSGSGFLTDDPSKPPYEGEAALKLN
jgi:hypothetical protein